MPYTTNVLTVAGTLMADPVLRRSNGGTPLCEFTLEFLRRWQKKGSDTWSEERLHYDCIAWRALAEELVSSTRAGWRLIVSGRFEMPEPGRLRIVADEIGVCLGDLASTKASAA